VTVHLKREEISEATGRYGGVEGVAGVTVENKGVYVAQAGRRSLENILQSPKPQERQTSKRMGRREFREERRRQEGENECNSPSTRWSAAAQWSR